MPKPPSRKAPIPGIRGASRAQSDLPRQPARRTLWGITPRLEAGAAGVVKDSRRSGVTRGRISARRPLLGYPVLCVGIVIATLLFANGCPPGGDSRDAGGASKCHFPGMAPKGGYDKESCERAGGTWIESPSK